MPSRLCCPNYAIQLGRYPIYVIPILSALGCVDISCHAECSEESEVCEWSIRNDFRFFTPLRCVQNDREGRCVQNDRINMRCVQNDSIDILIKSRMLCVSNVNRA